LYVFTFFFAPSKFISADSLVRNPRRSHMRMARFPVMHFFLLTVSRCIWLQLLEGVDRLRNQRTEQQSQGVDVRVTNATAAMPIH